MATRARHDRLVALDGREVRVAVRESARARRARLWVGPHHPPRLVVPRGASDAAIDGFLHVQAGWLERQLRHARAVEERPSQLGLDRPGVVWDLGSALPVSRRPAGRAVAELRAGVLQVGGCVESAAGAVDRWYRRQARLRVEEIAGEEAARLGLAYAGVTIRDPRTRWGSCSSRGTLSFSWRLLLPPREVLEYVVVHELCHLRQRNHSKAFWRLVDEALPGWRARAGWLREHQHELQRYRPAIAVGGSHR
jgi:hypothetical protein